MPPVQQHDQQRSGREAAMIEWLKGVLPLVDHEHRRNLQEDCRTVEGLMTDADRTVPRTLRAAG